MSFRLSAVALAAGLSIASAAVAQSGQQTQPQNPSSGERATPQQRADRPAAERANADRSAAGASKVAKADSDFLKQAAQNGHAEVEASKLAQTKATQPDLKSFAQKMVDDHTKTNQELMALAKSKGVELPDGPSLMQRAKLKMLAGADGEKFDRRYAEDFGVKAHEDTIKLFREGAEKAQDSEVKAFAQKKLPALQQHLTMAQAAHASVAPAAAGKSDRPAGDKGATERSRQGGTTGTGTGTTGGTSGTSGSGTSGERKP